MGSYCSLQINDYEIDASKSYIHPFMALIFRETDKRIRRKHYTVYFTEPIEANGDQVDAIEYAASKKVITQRLEILGNSLTGTITAFDENLNVIIEERSGWDFMEKQHITMLKNLKNAGFYGWQRMVKKLIAHKVHKYDIDTNVDSERNLDHFLLSLSEEEFFLGYPSLEYGLVMRAIAEVMNDDDELILDITSLVHAGYYEASEEVCSNTIAAELAFSRPYQKILILTEGSTDSIILSKAIKILYPHLSDYFSFMDFANARPDGGTSALERTVKSFAASGVSNKIIALFDNDATGKSSFEALRKFSFPPNIKLLVLPDLELAKQYPTIGPQGEINVNINGKACSIELYLGENILRNEAGSFIPVRWTSLDSRLNEYQGEITEKKIIQTRFWEIVKQVEAQPQQLYSHSWDGLRQILDMLFIESASL